MDVSQYLEIFLDETKEHLQNLNTQILSVIQAQARLILTHAEQFSLLTKQTTQVQYGALQTLQVSSFNN